MVTLRTRVDFSLFPLFFLILDKFMALLRVCLGSRFVKTWLLSKVRLSHLTSKIKFLMKWWSKHISMVIAKTASRNVASKVTKIADSALAGQSEILTREVEVARDDVPTDEEALDDLRRNADLYIFHQDDADSQQVNDVTTGCQCQLQSQYGEDVHHFQSLSLD